MPTQEIGKIKIVVNNQGLGPLTVKQSTQTDSRVRTISYGQPFELGKAVDLNLRDANTGESIIYNAETNKFDIGPGIANTVVAIFGGTF